MISMGTFTINPVGHGTSSPILKALLALKVPPGQRDHRGQQDQSALKALRALRVILEYKALQVQSALKALLA